MVVIQDKDKRGEQVVLNWQSHCWVSVRAPCGERRHRKANAISHILKQGFLYLRNVLEFPLVSSVNYRSPNSTGGQDEGSGKREGQ